MNSPATHARPSAHPTTPDQLLAASDLPAPIPARIAAIVRATRLWKSEQADITRELIAHAQDALAAGQSPEQTAADLGDPKTIAPLLRLGARRKRSWHWQARHRINQAVGISILLTLGAYTVLFIRFNTGRPDIKHNYLAELNERNSRYTPDQRALLAYESLAYAWQPFDRRLREQAAQIESEATLRNHAFYRFPLTAPTDPGFESLLAAYRSVLPEIERAIASSNLPTLGIYYSDRHEQIITEDGTVRYHVLPLSDDPALGTPVIEVLLPWLGHSRNIAKIFAFDAVLAARDGNPDRCAKSLIAVFNSARLIGEEHTLIASLVSIAIQMLGEGVLLEILQDHPDLLSESHLSAIAHTATISSRAARDLDFATERRMFGDFLQRAYTDDGQQNGRLTADGLRLIQLYTDSTDHPDGHHGPAALATRFTGPFAMAWSGSRADQRKMYDRIINQVEAGLRTSPAAPEQAYIRADFDAAMEQLRDDRRYWVVSLLAPAFNKSVTTAHRAEAHTNATLTTIALHIHHQRTGQWPDTLTELTPHLLPTIPEDPFDPGRPIKYRLIDGVPHIYFIGSDAEDNHATRPIDEAPVSSLERRYNPPPPPTDPSTLPSNQGDWIIFPPSPAGGASGRWPG